MRRPRASTETEGPTSRLSTSGAVTSDRGDRLLRGRNSSFRTRRRSSVAIVNQAMANNSGRVRRRGRRLFEGEPCEGESYEVVGVVETGKYRTLGRTRAGRVPFPASAPGPRSTFVAHVRGDPKFARRDSRRQRPSTRGSPSRLGPWSGILRWRCSPRGPRVCCSALRGRGIAPGGVGVIQRDRLLRLAAHSRIRGPYGARCKPPERAPHGVATGDGLAVSGSAPAWRRPSRRPGCFAAYSTASARWIR